MGLLRLYSICITAYIRTQYGTNRAKSCCSVTKHLAVDTPQDFTDSARRAQTSSMDLCALLVFYLSLMHPPPPGPLPGIVLPCYRPFLQSGVSDWNYIHFSPPTAGQRFSSCKSSTGQRPGVDVKSYGNASSNLDHKDPFYIPGDSPP